ncbi:MAG: NIPSNAP family protein [Pseudorhodoplanes sp.]|uniref:NIPSNAP family protein n=1 Tax=Pseudorhodoplanes sp. TaxID=1934341 RepID=UPI003D124BF5
MIFEMRTYTAHPGRLNGWLKVYEERRLPILERHLGRLVAAFTPETGTINQFVQIWGYESHADRAARRATLWKDADWLDPAANTSEALQCQESVILVPTRFSPLG